jgi:UDP-glucuronate decarboxylase
MYKFESRYSKYKKGQAFERHNVTKISPCVFFSSQFSQLNKTPKAAALLAWSNAMAPTASIASPEMTPNDDRNANVHSDAPPPVPTSPVAIVAREEPAQPARPRAPVSLPRQVQRCTMQRILVTGGAGFIGIHLCRRLLEQGHEVICLDNLFTSQRANVLELQTRFPSFEFVRHDVTEPYACEVDQIYNLACPASPVHYQYNPIKTTKVSFMGAINVLGLAKRVKARVFQASTSEVYGDPEVSPQVESYLGNVDCTGVRACYDEGKRVAETLFFEYHRTLGVDIRVARIFNTYGPGMHPYDGRVVSNFIMQALQGEDITIYGSGDQTRSFCFVDDLVEAIVRFMDCSTCVGPMNLGNPHEMTIRQLAEMIIRLTNSRSRLVFRDLPNNDPKLRKPDITLAKYVCCGLLSLA